MVDKAYIEMKKILIDKEQISLSKEILKWYLGSEKILNVISLPFNGCDIFIPLIFNCVNENMLYITNEKDHIKIIETMKKIKNDNIYTVFRGGESIENKKITICSYENALQLRKHFHLIIYDDINSFPEFENADIISCLVGISSMDTKIICYSIDKIFKNTTQITIPFNKGKVPLVEPRIINTNINLNKDMPYLAYEYINWTFFCEKNLIIYVPNMKSADKVYNYVSKYRFEHDIKIIKVLSCGYNHCELDKIEKNFKYCYVTDCIEKFINVDNVNIMIIFSEGNSCDFKKIVSLCGKVCTDSSNKGEVLLLCRDENEDIEKAKDITRTFNKEAWNLGCLNLY